MPLIFYILIISFLNSFSNLMCMCNLIDVNDISYEIRASTQAYLDAYFYYTSELFLRPQDILDASSVKSSEFYLRHNIATCFRLTQERMQQYRSIYIEEAYIATKRLLVREDDALRLFFYGDLTTCITYFRKRTLLKTLDIALPVNNNSSSRSAIDETFLRSGNTPILLSTEEERALEAIVHEYLTLSPYQQESPFLSAINIFSYIRLELYSGVKGLLYSTLTLVATLVFYFYLATHTHFTQDAVKSSCIDDNQSLLESSPNTNRLHKRKRPTQKRI